MFEDNFFRIFNERIYVNITNESMGIKTCLDK